MPDGSVPGFGDQRRQDDIVLALGPEVSGRRGRRAGGDEPVAALGGEGRAVRGEDVRRDQPLAVETVEVGHHLAVPVGQGEVPHRSRVRVEIDLPCGGTLVRHTEGAVEGGVRLSQVHRVGQADRAVDRVHGLLEVGLELLGRLRHGHPEAVQPVLACEELEHVPQAREARIVDLGRGVDVAVGEGQALTDLRARLHQGGQVRHVLLEEVVEGDERAPLAVGGQIPGPDPVAVERARVVTAAQREVASFGRTVLGDQAEVDVDVGELLGRLDHGDLVPVLRGGGRAGAEEVDRDLLLHDRHALGGDVLVRVLDLVEGVDLVAVPSAGCEDGGGGQGGAGGEGGATGERVQGHGAGSFPGGG